MMVTGKEKEEATLYSLYLRGVDAKEQPADVRESIATGLITLKQMSHFRIWNEAIFTVLSI